MGLSPRVLIPWLIATVLCQFGKCSVPLAFILLFYRPNTHNHLEVPASHPPANMYNDGIMAKYLWFVCKFFEVWLCKLHFSFKMLTFCRSLAVISHSLLFYFNLFYQRACHKLIYSKHIYLWVAIFEPKSKPFCCVSFISFPSKPNQMLYFSAAGWINSRLMEHKYYTC